MLFLSCKGKYPAQMDYVVALFLNPDVYRWVNPSQPSSAFRAFSL